MRIDIRPNDKGHDVEKRHPGLLRQELLRKRQAQRGGDPADFHDGHEARADGGSDLMQGSRARDHGHAGEVDGVLNRRDL